MSLVLAAVAVLVVGAFLALRSARLGVAAVVAAGALGFVASVRALLGGTIERLHTAWRVPYGAFTIELDALSAFFLALIFGLSALAAIYGDGYLRGKKSVGARTKANRLLWEATERSFHASKKLLVAGNARPSADAADKWAQEQVEKLLQLMNDQQR
jgi:formate hydrogenlyase subunit 3/multisubunit Na+/H+ antiporter MnhD subunit